MIVGVCFYFSYPTSNVKATKSAFACISCSDVRIFEISNRIEWLLAIRFDLKLTQLFKIFEYLFNRDQPGD